MPDKSKTETNVIPRQSWSQESITKEKIIFRKFINPAIYVEKEMLPARKTSPLSVTESDEGYQSIDKRRPTTTVPESTKKNSFPESSSKRRVNKVSLIKKCTCSKSKSDCQCHPSDPRQLSSDIWEVSSTSSTSSTETQITVKIQTLPTEIPPPSEVNNMSITSLTSFSNESIALDPIEKEERIKQWLKKKEQEQKLKKLEGEKIQKQKEEQLALQKEQKNKMYKQWLEKKKQEEKHKKNKEKDEEKKKIDEERLKKQSEGEQMFQSWLKIKKKEKIEKKLQGKKKELKEYEEKKKRLEESQRAFDEWLKNSKYKQKPVPSNQGLSSLFLSNLVTYVNPEPWVGNVEHKKSNQVQTTFTGEKDHFPVVGSGQLITKGLKNY